MTNKDDFKSMQDAIKSITNSMTYFLKNFETLNTRKLQNMATNVSRVSKTYETLNTRKLQNMAINVSRVSKTYETLNTRKLQNIATNISHFSKSFSTLNTEILQNTIKNTSISMPKIKVVAKTLDNYSETISEFDWKDFKPTEKDIQKAYAIIEDENAEENISKELNSIKKGQKIKSYIYTIVIIIASIIGFISDCITVIEYTEQTIFPIVKASLHHIFDSDKKAIKWLNNELKKEVEIQLINNFRIVSKDDLIVREGKKVDSKIKGKLNSKCIVQVVEKKKNWTYIFYSNYKTGEVIEGWVFTRYLKKIK